MQNPFSRKSKDKQATRDALAEAEQSLADKEQTLAEAQSAYSDAETALHDALNSDAPDQTITKAEKALDNARKALQRAQHARDAAAKQVGDAQRAAHEAAHAAEVKRLDNALKTRETLAKKLADNAKARADVIRQWLKTDEALTELNSKGFISESASPGHTWGIGRLLRYLEFEDRRNTVDLEEIGQRGFPYVAGGWTDRTTIPAIRDAVEQDNQTIKGS